MRERPPPIGGGGVPLCGRPRPVVGAAECGILLACFAFSAAMAGKPTIYGIIAHLRIPGKTEQKRKTGATGVSDTRTRQHREPLCQRRDARRVSRPLSGRRLWTPARACSGGASMAI